MDLNQGLLHLWSKFGGPSLNGWWVITWRSMWLTTTHTNRRRQWQYPRLRPKLASSQHGQSATQCKHLSTQRWNVYNKKSPVKVEGGNLNHENRGLFQCKDTRTCTRISNIKIRWFHNHLIFIIGIPIPFPGGNTTLHIETGPRPSVNFLKSFQRISCM